MTEDTPKINKHRPDWFLVSLFINVFERGCEDAKKRGEKKTCVRNLVIHQDYAVTCRLRQGT